MLPLQHSSLFSSQFSATRPIVIYTCAPYIVTTCGNYEYLFERHDIVQAKLEAEAPEADIITELGPKACRLFDLNMSGLYFTIRLSFGSATVLCRSGLNPIENISAVSESAEHLNADPTHHE
jgi:hypothetical protein